MSGPLQGIRVLDMSRFIAGPYCSMLLGDMGAEVIKIERAGKGEDARSLPPFVDNDPEKVSLYYTQYNKNKKGITVDFRNPKGIELIKSLLTKMDVLVENFRPGTLEKMGLTKEVFFQINPKLIVTSISGFGQDGPYRNRAAFDCIGQAMSGLMSVTGEANGDPLLTGTWVSDFTTGIYAAFGTVSALIHQQRTGQGQVVDISLLESSISLLATAIPLYAVNGMVQPRRGNRDNVTGPANLFQTKDGKIYLHAGTDPLFKRLAAVMGHPELNDDPRYCTSSLRMQCIEEVEDLVQQWIGQKSTQEAENILVGAGIPCSRISSAEDLIENPQILHREAIQYAEYPGSGKIPLPGVTVKLSQTPGCVENRPPLLGEHNYEVYGELLGLGKEEIDVLVKEKII